MRSAEELARLMAGYACSPQEQIAQTAMRMQLAQDWGIAPGMRVLEIGCGQGDMTAVLAEAVGPNGSVTAVDSGPGDYGAPVTLQESAAHLLAGPLGDRISFSFSCDVTGARFEEPFDAVVLALCTWYFDSRDQIVDVLERASFWAPKLCLAEWDMRPQALSQVGHLMAVLIQGQITLGFEQNVRTPYSREDLAEMLLLAGLKVEREATVDTSALADARWEIDACLHNGLGSESHAMLSPERLKFVSSQLNVLKGMKAGATCLPIYAITASRGS